MALTEKQVSIRPVLHASQFKPCVLWMTGLSGAGKTSIAERLKLVLRQQLGINTYVLDGDVVRSGLCSDLGFSNNDRKENIRRVAEVSRMFVDAGIITISACISPFASDREAAKRLFSQEEFIEVFVDTPLNVCEKRDVKGLYRKARLSQVSNFTGIGSGYEKPVNPNIHLKNDAMSIRQATSKILDYLTQQGYLPGDHPLSLTL